VGFLLTFYRKNRGKKCDESLGLWVVFCYFCWWNFISGPKGFILPLPIDIFAGALLSIASNYFQDMGNLFARNEQVYQTASLSDIPEYFDGRDSSADSRRSSRRG
jgi:hypothetical protein